ncbi:hypothetical protein NE237_032965 [Protea cynaroides]|uniref:Uncharacterized protein n=1 Tax=Protea cynaroides TaxID=273540 RepID=A0A9Q0L400_9MAGN|nr:hypothetical protein NE237_032965 [Protea cynaroides]
MASVPSFKPLSDVSSPSSTFCKIDGFSKAQMGLKKNHRHHFISWNLKRTIGESTIQRIERRLDVDLNLRLGLPLEMEGSENPLENGGFSACSTVGGPDGKKLVDDFAVTKENKDIKAVEEETRKFLEISNLLATKREERGHLTCWMFDLYESFDDISPVVRSKHGKNQVLPSRYKNCVLEP